MHDALPQCTEGGQKGESPRAALLKEWHFEKNVKIYVKMVQFMFKEVKFLVNTDKRAEN